MIHWSYHILHHIEGVDLIEYMNATVKNHQGSQPKYYWQYGLNNSLLWGAILCSAECLAASLTPPTVHLQVWQVWQPAMSPHSVKYPVVSGGSYLHSRTTGVNEGQFGATLSIWDSVLQKVVHIFNQWPVKRASPWTAKITKVWE